MIITKLQGGLGNQMFQYALGRYLSLKNKTILKIDLDSLSIPSLQNDITPRFYQLHIFNVKENIAYSSEINEFKNKSLIKKIKSKLGLNRYIYISQRTKLFEEYLLSLQQNIYLDGYWQSEKYFKDIENIIRQDFIFKAKPDSINSQLIEKMSAQNSVSIHFRRGDYISNPKTNQTHSVCSLEYYKKAMKLILDKISNLHFYLFSDDIEWIKQFLKIDYPHSYIDHNKCDYEDLRLMMNCKHNIIANSSFSWWGAWLNNNSNKIVIAPDKWFNDPSIDTRDLIPEKWIRI